MYVEEHTSSREVTNCSCTSRFPTINVPVVRWHQIDIVSFISQSKPTLDLSFPIFRQRHAPFYET